MLARWDRNDGPGKGFGLENFKMAGLSKVLLHVFNMFIYSLGWKKYEEFSWPFSIHFLLFFISKNKF